MSRNSEPTIEELDAEQPPHAWRSKDYEDWSREDLIWRILFLQSAGRDAWKKQAAEYERGLADGERGECAARAT